MKELVLLDQSLNKHVDVFHLLLLLGDQYSLLPEIYEVFGDKALMFMDMFAGSTVRLPDPKDLKIAAMKTDIYIVLSNTDNFHDSAGDLASRYDIPIKRVKELYKEVKDYVTQYYRAFKVTGERSVG